VTRRHPLWTAYEQPTQEQVAAARVDHDSWSTESVEVVPPDRAWSEWFAAVRDRVVGALGDRALTVEHVGSTAVPGLWAKPVVDVDVTVADVEDEGSWLPALQDAGFVLRVREPDWQGHRLVRGEDPPANVHVWPVSAVEPRRHVVFRDWLCTHEDDREQYAEAKRAAASRGFTDVMLYNNEKAGVIYDLYEKMFAADPDHEHDPVPRQVVRQ
jgi:GrpB-like predicted nucleotidyltransferase (UPF0157 family)